MTQTNMQKRVFIIHGWDGNPDEGWFPWLKHELEQRGFEVHVPAMPNPSVPTIEAWVAHLAQVVGQPDENTFFIGHSIGCQTILRYLAGLQEKKVGGAIFVAGWFVLSDLETEEEKLIGKPWIETPIDFDRIMAATHKLTAIFSEDDPVVPFEINATLFKDKLSAKIVTDNGKKHFSGSDGVTELPSVLKNLS